MSKQINFSLNQWLDKHEIEWKEQWVIFSSKFDEFKYNSNSNNWKNVKFDAENSGLFSFDIYWVQSRQYFYVHLCKLYNKDLCVFKPLKDKLLSIY